MSVANEADGSEQLDLLLIRTANNIESIVTSQDFYSRIGFNSDPLILMLLMANFVNIK